MGIHFETDVFAAVTVVDAKAPYITLRPTKTTMLRSWLFYMILSSDRLYGAVSFSWSLTSLCDSCSCAALS